MPIETMTTYFMALSVVEAQEALRKMQIADYPNMKKESRATFQKKMTAAANSYTDDKVHTSRDFAAKLSRMTHG